MPTKSFPLNVDIFACNNWLITWSDPRYTIHCCSYLSISSLRFSYVGFKNCIALAKSSIARNLDPLPARLYANEMIV